MVETIGIYEIRRERGRGAAAIVYEAFHPRLSRRVALKVVAKSGTTAALGHQLLARFRQEARITATLDHAGVVAVHDFDETPDFAFLAMEFVDGETLRERLDRAGPLPAAHAVDIMVAVLRTLEYCHQAGVIHRDIKPSNLMLPAAGGVKLTDFGIARADYPSTDTLMGTQFGTWMGTPPYMSPEQFMAQAPVDQHTDIWSCGVVLFELLTGQRPFRGDANAIAYQVVNEAAPDVRALKPEISARLAAVLARALAKRAADRFPTAGGFADALTAALARPPPEARARPVAQHVRRYVLPAVVALLLAVGAWQAVRGWQARQDRIALEDQQRANDRRQRAAQAEQERQRAAQAEQERQRAAQAELERQRAAQAELERQRALAAEAAAHQRIAAEEAARQRIAAEEARRPDQNAGTDVVRPPADPPAPAVVRSSWDHNGSVMAMESTGTQLRIMYFTPRAAMADVGVQRGTVLFTGLRDGARVHGTAHVFKAGCDPAPYPVSGSITDERSLELLGAAPIWARDRPCAIARYDSAVSDGRLRFSFLRQGYGP